MREKFTLQYCVSCNINTVFSWYKTCLEACMRRVWKVKIHQVWADRENFYAYCGNVVIDLDPLPVSRAHLTVVEPLLVEWDVFELAAPIQSCAKCEVHSVVWFFNAKGECPTEIHKQIVAVYGNIMNWQNVTKWCHEFSEGRTDVHNEQRSGRSPLISDDLLQEIEGEICANWLVTIRELHRIIPEVSETTIHEAVTEKLGYRKLCARWVPKILTDDHKMKWMGSGKIQVRFIGPSAIQSRPCAQRFPLVSSPKETSR
jgi:hypothetical protein